jgi:flavin-dependent dehydrogenase
MPYDFDLLVIGSGPGGQKAAIQAAKPGKRVAVIARREMVGGVCTNTGTIPSKTLREAVLYLTGMSERGIYGQSTPGSSTRIRPSPPTPSSTRPGARGRPTRSRSRTRALRPTTAAGSR